MELDFCPFAPCDYMAFGGAPEGSQIAWPPAGDVTVVLGGQGTLEVYILTGDDDEEHACYTLEAPGLTALGAATLLLPVPLGRADTFGEALLALGFSVQEV